MAMGTAGESPATYTLLEQSKRGPLAGDNPDTHGL